MKQPILSCRASGGGYRGKEGEIKVLIQDSNPANLVISVDALTVTEGASGTFTVKLSAPPKGNVTVRLMSRGSSATLSKDSLVFTSANWNEVQAISVSTNEDGDPDDNFAFISLKASGPGYDGVTTAVAVSVPDNDRPPGLLLSATELNIDEGASSRLGVRLAAPPSTEVTLTASIDDEESVAITQETLTFTPINWSTEQNFELRGLEDRDTADQDGLILTLVASGGSYEALRSQAMVSVLDDDSAGIEISQAELKLTEGQRAHFQVRLMSVPRGQVTLRISSDDPEAASTSPARLIFTRDNWDAEQLVVVTGTQDADRDDESVTVNLAGLGGEYTGLTRSIAVAIEDEGQGGGCRS